MATFYSSSTAQRDMPMLYTKEQQDLPSNPSVTGSGGMMYMHYPSSGAYLDMLTGFTGSQNDCIDLPVSTTMIPQGSPMVEPGSFGLHSYDGMRDGRNEILFLQMVGGSTDGGVNFMHGSVTDDQMGILHRQNSCMQSAVNGQGLSLSLGNQIPASSFQYHPASSDFSIMNSHQSTLVTVGSCGDDSSRNRLMNAELSSCTLSNLMSAIPSSKYLKVAQQLLDEVVNIQKTARQKADKSQSLNTSGTTSCKEFDGSSKADGMPLKTQDSTVNSSRVLSPSERQDFQNKLAKLSAMLDEFKELAQAYEVLSDPEKCDIYDQWGRCPRGGNGWWWRWP